METAVVRHMLSKIPEAEFEVSLFGLEMRISAAEPGESYERNGRQTNTHPSETPDMGC
jgi:hypothetical protein